MTTTPLLPDFTDEDIINITKWIPISKRAPFFRNDHNRNAYETVWNANLHLRSKDDNKAGAISEFYIATLPASPDEMYTCWASNPVRTAHLRYTASYLAEHIRKRKLPTLPNISPEGMGLIVSAHFLIDRSYRGFGNERALLNHLNTDPAYRGIVSSRFATADEDEKLGTDIFVKEETHHTITEYGIQVKPVSFLRGTGNHRLRRDREDLFDRIRQTERNGLQVLWHVIPNGGYSYQNPESPLLITTEEAWAKVPQ